LSPSISVSETNRIARFSSLNGIEIYKEGGNEGGGGAAAAAAGGASTCV
jgi:hypothetical protein